MPTYKQVLTDVYLPVQSSKARWESAKTVAGSQFDALVAERKAMDDISLRRQQYADNIRPRESSDAFVFAAAQNLATLKAAPVLGEKKKAKEFTDALDAVKSLPANTAPASPAWATVRSGLNATASEEEWTTLYQSARAKGFPENLQVPANKPKQAEIAQGSAAARQSQANQQAAGQLLLDLADALGPRAFQGGAAGRSWYESLADQDQELLNTYQRALLDDGQVTADEIPADRMAVAKELYDEANKKGGFRRLEVTAYDPMYLGLLQREAEARRGVQASEQRLAGKTKETLAVELFEGAEAAQAEAAIPPLLRSLRTDMTDFVTGFEAAQMADPRTDVDAYLTGKLNDRTSKGFQAAKSMAASGLKAQQIMDSLGALTPDERRKVMAALATRDAVQQRMAKVAPGTPLPEIQKIEADDMQAAAAQQQKIQTRLQRRLQELDQALSVDLGTDILTPSSRRAALMQGLQAEPSQAELDRQEVQRIADERQAARIERDRMMDTGLASYDPARNLPAPPSAPLDSNRGAVTAWDRVRQATLARIAAGEQIARDEAALATYNRAAELGPETAATVRSALMQGIAPQTTQPFIGREELRPEPFSIPQGPAPAPAPVPPPAPAQRPPPKPLSERTVAELEAELEALQSGGR